MSESIPQPLDQIMTKLGLSNAQLVNASTEQLTFKMVQKGRRGRRLTPNVQEKILNALHAAHPELRLRRRDLFRYEMNPIMVETIRQSLELATKGEVTYPQLVDLLAAAGITGYKAEVGPNRYTFYGTGGEAHVEEGPAVVEGSLGRYDETALKAVVAVAKKKVIDHPEFLRKIHAAGISVYDVNIRKRFIDYKGEKDSYRENVPVYVPEAPKAAEPAAEKAAPKVSAKKPSKAKKKRPGIVRTTRKQRLTFRRKLRASKKAKRPKKKRA